MAKKITLKNEEEVELTEREEVIYRKGKSDGYFESHVSSIVAIIIWVIIWKFFL